MRSGPPWRGISAAALDTRRSTGRFKQREPAALHDIGQRSPRFARGYFAMRIGPGGLELRRAKTLDDALSILASEPRMPIAGATDVYVGLNFGTLKERKYLDIWAVKELKGITVRGDTLVLGALATYTDLIRSKDVNARLPILVDASKLVGGPQIQNRGTIGGNVANASPAGDTLPVLAATNAVVVLRSIKGDRRVPFNEFYTGYRASQRKPNELIVAIEIPAVSGRQWVRKVGTRAAQAISKIVVAAVRGSAPAIAFGSVAPTVVRVPKTESALAGGAVLRGAGVRR